MKRVVYSPKVNVFVKTDTGIYDLTPYVTDCSVDRRINAVSSASVSFRNPSKKFTNGPNGPVFHPMDPIVITMTRLHNTPVQVFTGYCDSTPYLQLKPGIATITASCTLKRLLYTYWDPGLPFVQMFLHERGWRVSPEGSLENPEAMHNTRDDGNDEEPDAGSGQQGSALGDDDEEDDINADDLGRDLNDVDDGSIGGLLFDIMQYIGNWHPDTIYIENIPPSVYENAEALHGDINKANKKSQRQFKKLLKHIIGESSLGGGGLGASGVGDAGGAGPASESEVTSVDVGRAMITAGWTTNQEVLANGMQVVVGESTNGAGAGVFTPNEANCVGYWQIQLHSHTDKGATLERCNNLVQSTKIAKQIYEASSGWGPWVAYTGAYEPYMAAAAKAIKKGPFVPDVPNAGSGQQGSAL